ncbi:T9SS type A sorting domain-containing protein [Flavobacterium sp. NKUCC04_CG]|uniref:T9SS type A sorting domain-containing protein n=1 Tax=Flavobacterium sp. NKUCC04_CG TaxID=2842121 RepID=UPI001C5A60CB|nr:T9SS type A sorting domain-containing protein [Flavobacterium sp. NKUCC04_CG]MBW3519764.1 trypsin-like peptidase domain-containing protein [Flavobacterium sp. NKUCC04_CG]
MKKLLFNKSRIVGVVADNKEATEAQRDENYFRDSNVFRGKVEGSDSNFSLLKIEIRRKWLLTLIVVVCNLFVVSAQLHQTTVPASEKFKLDQKIYEGLEVKKFPELNRERLKSEDAKDLEMNVPPRFGYRHLTDMNTKNSGKWMELPNGDKLWLLKISIPNALSINLLYDKFWLPEKGMLFLYNEDKTTKLGAFTAANNKGKAEEVRGFATDLIYGNTVILEYYQPKEVVEEPVISIQYVVEGYRYIKNSLSNSGGCQVNVNCPEGAGWQLEKNAVALIVVNGYRYCTGALMRNTADNNRALFLTADHCLGGWANNVKHDAMSNKFLDHWTFWWQYESPNCSNPAIEPVRKSTSGAVVLANAGSTDFALLELNENPSQLTNSSVAYLGWERLNPKSGGVGIHHPSGDIKKIATFTMTPKSTAYSNTNVNQAANHWMVNWVSTATNHGVTEGGSSGSPLLNSNKRVIGQLHGGSASCTQKEAPDWYGKFSLSWDGNRPERRLKDWLDPLQYNVMYLDSSSGLGGDFHIRNSVFDSGVEPDANTPANELYISPDIWVRNFNDNGLVHQNATHHPYQLNYVYVRVKNRGTVVTSANSLVQLHWSKASTASTWPKFWNGSYWFNGVPTGGVIGVNEIPILQPGEETILKFPWRVPNPNNYVVMDSQQPGHFCLIARVLSEEDPMTFMETSDVVENVQNNNNIAWKNLSVVDITPEGYNGASVLVGNPFDGKRVYSLDFLVGRGEVNQTLFREAEITATLDPVLYRAWERGGRRGQQIERVERENTIRIAGPEARLDNVVFYPDEFGVLSLTFNFLTGTYTDQRQYHYNVVQIDADNHKVIGGEGFVINKTSRQIFRANAGAVNSVRAGEVVSISAADIGEEAAYRWYDDQGELVSSSKEFLMNIEKPTRLQLEVTALADGFKDYDFINIDLKPSTLGIITPNPASTSVEIEYDVRSDKAAYIELIPIYEASGNGKKFSLDTHNNKITINISAFTKGVYSVVLYSDGERIDVKKLIIQ